MKVTRVQAAASRERILDAAARLLRERGPDGVGVAEIMEGAGLTHGGFYGHFASKEDLMAQACRRALEASAEKWEAIAEAAGPRALAAIAHHYVSTRHRDNCANGCVVAAVGVEASRQDPGVRREVAAGIEAQIEILSRVVPGRAGPAKRRKVLASYAAMVGAVVLARAVDDPRISKDILDAVAQALE